ncbi:uncharacterized protein AB675_6749 [Cyphellophora attinorum]|uniref:37S ribosomal protein mrp10, mitochondrial n=1 Tax=Cyphellophora attinorum TaxID=1664694 RepID=A0A0N1P2G1_9EURO|nr:uncharacterized protein AB675_6749 [Phialophora attinorum]KPI43667.1 hypothetical protein AB675_6749 [Phialophora attinorum]
MGKGVGASTAMNPVRLQSVSKLKIAGPHLPHRLPLAPCSACALEQALRECMDFSKKQPPKKNNINYHLSRLYPKIRGPQKKDGVLK